MSQNQNNTPDQTQAPDQDQTTGADDKTKKSVPKPSEKKAQAEIEAKVEAARKEEQNLQRIKDEEWQEKLRAEQEKNVLLAQALEEKNNFSPKSDDPVKIKIIVNVWDHNGNKLLKNSDVILNRSQADSLLRDNKAVRIDPIPVEG